MPETRDGAAETAVRWEMMERRGQRQSYFRKLRLICRINPHIQAQALRLKGFLKLRVSRQRHNSPTVTCENTIYRLRRVNIMQIVRAERAKGPNISRIGLKFLIARKKIQQFPPGCT